MAQLCGFDMHPALRPTKENRTRYANFITTILARYSSRCLSPHSTTSSTPLSCLTPKSKSKSSPKFKSKRGCAQVIPTPGGAYILFIVPGLPIIPYTSNLCEYFVRFSSTVKTELIWDVYEIARTIFGERVRWWSEDSHSGDRVGIWEAEFVEERHRGMMRELEDAWADDEGDRTTAGVTQLERSASRSKPVRAVGEEEKTGMVEKRHDIGSKKREESNAVPAVRPKKGVSDRKECAPKVEHQVTKIATSSSKSYKTRRHGMLTFSSQKELPSPPKRKIEPELNKGRSRLAKKGQAEHREDITKFGTLCDQVFALRSK